jgi:hypothetical protein
MASTRTRFTSHGALDNRTPEAFAEQFFNPNTLRDFLVETLQ